MFHFSTAYSQCAGNKTAPDLSGLKPTHIRLPRWLNALKLPRDLDECPLHVSQLLGVVPMQGWPTLGLGPGSGSGLGLGLGLGLGFGLELGLGLA